MKSMLSNLCNMLVYHARPLIKYPDAPVTFYHGNSEGGWVVQVYKLPKEEKNVVNG